jgi:UPF0716 protein FxsA
VLFGGILLIIPGFISDAVGIVLLAPPTRALVRRIAARRLARRLPRAHRRPSATYDVDSTARDIDQPVLPR